MVLFPTGDKCILQVCFGFSLQMVNTLCEHFVSLVSLMFHWWLYMMSRESRKHRLRVKEWTGRWEIMCAHVD